MKLRTGRTYRPRTRNCFRKVVQLPARVVGLVWVVLIASAFANFVHAQNATISGSTTACVGDASPQVSFTFTGGTAPYVFTYTINDGPQIEINSSSSSYLLPASTSVAGTFTYELVSAKDGGNIIIPGSGVAVVTINGPPSISTGPQSISTGIGCTASFSVTASGAGPFTYQWRKGGNNITGATNATYSIASVSATDAGNYDVVVSNGCGDVTSSLAALTVSAPLTAGSHNVDPITACSNYNPAPLTVSAPSGGSPAYTYQWLQNGLPVGTNSDTYDPGNLVDPGTYTIKVRFTDACGTVVESQPKTITIVEDPTVTIGGATSYCQGQAATLTATVTNGTGTIGYQWLSSPDGTTWTAIGGATGSSYSPATSAAGTMHYRVTVTVNGSACNNARDEAVIIVNSLPTIFNVSGGGSYCSGGTGVQIGLNGSQSGVKYQLQRNGANVGTPLDGTGGVISFGNQTTAGTYSVVATNTSTSCTANMSGSVDVVVNPLPTASLTSQTNVLCFGNATGGIDLSVSGGTSPYTYSWSNGATTQDISNLSAGTYSVTVTDASGCTTTVNNIAITQPTAALGAAETHVNVLCYGASTGSIDLSVSGGTSPYSYSWSNGATTQDISNLTAGTYGVTVSDASGCTTTVNNIAVTQPTAALSANETHVNVLCYGASTGSIDLSVSGGTSPYSYSWSNGATTQDISNLAAGTYSVTVTDANGCTTTVNNIAVTQPTAALSATENQVNVLCYGASTGSIDLSVSGGTSLYTYSWSNGATTQDINNLAAGTYSVTVTDASGCTTTVNNIAITQPSAALNATENHVNVLCYGASTGSIDLSVSGGTSPYTYSWSNGATTQDISNLAAGTYSVTVTDASGCTTTVNNIAITQPSAALNATENHVNVLCYGNSTGSIDLSVSGGTSPYTYSWNNGATTQDISNLAAGTYSVTVTDASGCTTTVNNIAVTQPTAVTITTIASNAPICSGASLNLTSSANGGTGGLSYSWTGPNGFNSTSPNPSIASATTAATGKYDLTVTDANGCSATGSVNVVVNPLPTPTLTSSEADNTICAGEAVTFTAGGGTNYEFFVNGVSKQNGSSNTYTTTSLTNGQTVTVKVTDGNGCSATSTGIATTVNPLLTPSVNISPSANNICAGTPVTFTASAINGGTNPSYQWFVNGSPAGSGGNTFTSTTLVNGDKVTLQMTSDAVCPNPATVTSNTVTMAVNALVTPSVTIAPNADNICPGTNVTFTATAINGGGTPTYQWYVDNVAAGGSSSTFSTSTLTDDQVVKVVMTTNASCPSQPTAEGSYTINVLPAPVPSVSVAASANNICPGTSVTFTATPTNGGSNPSYQWYVGSSPAGTNSASFTSSTLSNGQVVKVVMTSTATCAAPKTAEASVSMTVLPAPVPSVIVSPDVNNVCPGTTINFTAAPTNGGTAPAYQWYVGSTAVGTNSPNYSSSSLNNGDVVKVVMTSNEACANPTTANGNVTIQIRPAAPVTPGVITGPSKLCINSSNQTYSISAVANATTYTWTVPSGWNIVSGQGTTSVVVSTSGSAVSGNVTVTAGNSCGTSSAQTFAVAISTGPPATPGPILGVTAVCPAKTLVYAIDDVPGADSYTWSFPANWSITSGQGTTSVSVQVPTNASPGSVSVIATNVCGSSAASTLSVTVGSIGVDAGPDQTICAGTTQVTMNGNVTGLKNNEWFWEVTSGTISNQNKLNAIYTLPAGFTSGTITVKLSSNTQTAACPLVQDAMLITVKPTPTASISVSGTNPVCLGNSSTITFTATPNTTVSYQINGGATQTVSVGASGSATLNTANLSSATTYSLVSVAYPGNPSCITTVTGSAVINVTPLPTVNAGGPDLACQSATPTPITLSGASVGGSATTGAWSIVSGGGTLSSTSQTNSPANVQYTPAPNYSGTVVLRLTTNAPSPCAAVYADRTITVNPRPTAVAGGPDVVCQSASPAAITLTGASVGGSATTGAWSITSGSGTLSSTAQTANPASVSFTPAANFSGTVVLTLTTNAASPCSPVTATRTITVNPLPTVSAGTAQSICSNTTATMNGSFGGGASSAMWSTSGSGTFSNNSPTAAYTPSAADINNGTVTLTYTTDDPAGPCGPVSASVTLTIKKEVIITSQPSNLNVCAGASADLTVSAVGDGLSYQWYKGTAPSGTAVSNSGTISGAQTSTLHFSTTSATDNGSYYVVISGTAPCSPVTSEQRTLSVDQAITITQQPQAQTHCEGETASFTVTADANGAPLTYQWRKDGVNITGANSATLTLNNITSANAGNYDVVINGPSGYTCGSITSSSVALTVNKHSTIALNSTAGTDAQTKCINTAITQITYAIGGGGTGASITAGALPAGVTGSFSNGVFTISGTPTTAGSFSYTVTTTGPCNNVSSSGTITVTPNSTLSLTSGNATQAVCANAPVANIIYTVGGGATGASVSGLPGGVTGSFNNGVFTIAGTPTVAGTYPYTVTTSGPCVNTSLSGTITVNANSTLSLTSASANQTLCINSVPTNISYAVGGGATGATVTGLPPGMTGSYSGGVFTISNTPTVAGTYNYTVTTTGICNNVSLGGTIVVDPAPAGGNLSPAITTVCGTTNSGTITLTGQSGTIIRWESSTNGGGTWSPIANTSTTLSYSNLPQTTLYRAVIQSGVCPIAYSTNAVVSMVPATTPTATVSPQEICLGQSANLGATANIQKTWADFDATFNQANPAGWRVTQNGSEIIFPANADNASTFPWSETNGPKEPFDGGVTYDNYPRPPLANDKFAIASGQVKTTLETPVFSTLGMTSAMLQFYQALVFQAGTTGKIEISTDGGSTYKTLQLYTGPLTIGNPATNWAPLNIDLTNYLGLNNLRIRFSYDGVGNSNWALDGLSLQPPGPTLTYNWTLINPSDVPSPYYLNATDQQNVTATPPAPGNYTYQVATTIGGCPGGTANVVVTVKPLPTCDISGPTTVCPGSSAVFSGPATSGYTYKWTITGGGTISGSTTSQNVTVNANNSCGSYTLTLITTVNGCSSSACTYTVNVVDTEKPVVSGQTTIPNLGCNPAAPTNAFITPTVTDNCPAPVSLKSGYPQTSTVSTVNCSSSQTRTWVYVDACGNESLPFVQTISWTSDVDKPVIALAPAGTLNCNPTAADITAAFGAASVTDNCSTGLTATGTVAAEVVNGCQVSVTKNWTVTDACGNTGTASQTITFTRDNTAPTVTGQADVTGTQCNVQPAFVAPTPADNCGTPTLKAGYPQDGAVTAGANCSNTQTRTWIYVDACGNESAPFVQTATWKVDIIPPTVSCPTVPPLCVVPGNNYAIPPLTASDNCTAANALTITYKITGATQRDGTGVDASGVFEVGVSTITWTVVDECGNTSSCSTEVTIDPKPTPTIYHN